MTTRYRATVAPHTYTAQWLVSVTDTGETGSVHRKTMLCTDRKQADCVCLLLQFVAGDRVTVEPRRPRCLPPE